MYPPPAANCAAPVVLGADDYVMARTMFLDERADRVSTPVGVTSAIWVLKTFPMIESDFSFDEDKDCSATGYYRGSSRKDRKAAQEKTTESLSTYPITCFPNPATNYIQI